MGIITKYHDYYCDVDIKYATKPNGDHYKQIWLIFYEYYSPYSDNYCRTPVHKIHLFDTLDLSPMFGCGGLYELSKEYSWLIESTIDGLIYREECANVLLSRTERGSGTKFEANNSMSTKQIFYKLKKLQDNL